MAFLKLGFAPDPEKYVLCTYYVEAPDLKKAGEELGAESSIGTWTKIGTMKESILEKLGARVYSINKNILKIAYPVDLFEENNMPQFLSDAAGNIFGMKSVQNLRMLDFEVPKAYASSFLGPEFGRDGVREALGTKASRRPHIGTIVKPKVGLNPKETAKVAYESWAGGLDFVKDDENLTSQKFCPFEERVSMVLDAKDKAQSETGEKKMYAANITGSAEVMLNRAEYVKELGGNCIMIDIITAGFSGFQYIRSHNFGMAIHAHRAMYAAFARNPKHGIAMLPIAKMARMCGADQLHIGTVVGKMEGAKDEVLAIHKSINSPMGKLKPLFSVCSGGLAPANVPDLLKIFGPDIVIQAGGGIHGHPDGTRAGAAALRQAVEAGMKGIPLSEYSKTHKELARSPEKWKM